MEVCKIKAVRNKTGLSAGFLNLALEPVCNDNVIESKSIGFHDKPVSIFMPELIILNEVIFIFKRNLFDVRKGNGSLHRSGKNQSILVILTECLPVEPEHKMLVHPVLKGIPFAGLVLPSF